MENVSNNKEKAFFDTCRLAAGQKKDEQNILAAAIEAMRIGYQFGVEYEKLDQTNRGKEQQV